MIDQVLNGPKTHAGSLNRPTWLCRSAGQSALLASRTSTSALLTCPVKMRVRALDEAIKRVIGRQLCEPHRDGSRLAGLQQRRVDGLHRIVACATVIPGSAQMNSSPP